MLSSYETEKEKIEAIKFQLKFCKEVLSQIPDMKQTFNVTKSVDGQKSRKSLNSQELSLNLKTLICQAIVKDAEGDGEKHILVGKRVKHRFRGQLCDEQACRWYLGKIISQVKS